ncbi:uncharacterized protein C8orf76 homolog [Terrapene carolina triunguis]|uniref:uncharacterized protein C8orf76 homolog n=1 Tax=Terrapene triunguis TaxID=2587831 RepID=UPI000E77477E|nr:uncharacterized protein C8orf76 homolog [Terrapene carolina triunguis]
MELALGFGFEFEDSVFARSRDRGRGGGCAAYTAKRCEPQWFCEDANSEDDVEILTAKKFRGDLAYRQQEFQKALYEYSSCLLLLPSSNVAMRRDVQEGQARCLAHLGRHKEALDIAEKLIGCIFSLRLSTFRLLLQITQLQQSSFALEKNLKVQRETEDKVKGFGLKEESLLLITEVMGEDLIPEKLKEDVQGEIKCVGPSALTSLVTTSAIEFEGKWFKKLQDSLSL